MTFGQFSSRVRGAAVMILLAGWLPAISVWIELRQAAAAEPPVEVRGRVVDDDGRPLAARLSVRDAAGRWHFAKTTAGDGSAVEYRKRRGPAEAMHTTLSAHPFTLQLPPGTYEVQAVRGKEYLPAARTLTVAAGQPAEFELKLRRWIDMAARGWYSGDTHSHRPLAETANLVLAEDLNVAFPLSHWVTSAGQTPQLGNRINGPIPAADPIVVSPRHVIVPMNTEYELFEVDGRRHTLGAVLILGLREPLQLATPPVAAVAREARRQGALLDLEKHSWPWSLMIVQAMDVDLFELANNHVWPGPFGLGSWTLEMKPGYMGLETDSAGYTEWGWIDYGFQTWYSLLNCGFRIQPTAGTGSGVHPVPLGFGRVYVEQPAGFSAASWLRQLKAGRSFVTTGPLLLVEFDGQPPGHVFQEALPRRLVTRGKVLSQRPLERIELIDAGEVASTLMPRSTPRPEGGYETTFEVARELKGSTWLAVRAFERHPEGRVRFAHSSPVHIEVAGRPLHPRRAEVQYIVAHLRRELARNQGVLEPVALREYAEALAFYESLLPTAR